MTHRKKAKGLGVKLWEVTLKLTMAEDDLKKTWNSATKKLQLNTYLCHCLTQNQHVIKWNVLFAPLVSSFFLKECQLGPMHMGTFQLVPGNFKTFKNVDLRHHMFTPRLFAWDYNNLFQKIHVALIIEWASLKPIRKTDLHWFCPSAEWMELAASWFDLVFPVYKIHTPLLYDIKPDDIKKK